LTAFSWYVIFSVVNGIVTDLSGITII